MDINKITSYLLGNNPEKFDKISRLEFFEYVEKIYGYNIEKLNFFWEQASKYEEEFYKIIFEKFYSQSKKDDLEKAKLERLLKELGLLEILIKNKFNYAQLLQEFEAIIKTKSKVDSSESQTKGKQFEEFLKKLFNAINGLEEVKIKQAKDEQIDLVIKNNINKPFWISLKSPLIIGEAKNWSEKTNTEVINTLRGKNVGHNNLSKIGLVIAMNGFKETVDGNLLRDGASERIIVAITGDDIKELLTKRLDPIEWFEGMIVKSFI